MKELSELPWHEARRRSRENWQVLATQVVPIADAAYRILARDCPALIDLPTYATSAMDGFAVAVRVPGS